MRASTPTPSGVVARERARRRGRFRPHHLGRATRRESRARRHAVADDADAQRRASEGGRADRDPTTRKDGRSRGGGASGTSGDGRGDDAETSRALERTKEWGDEDEEADWTFEFPREPADVTNLWRTAPSRYRVLFTTVFAFVVCNMDKVNISVAIIPMARDFGWSSTTAGFIQSAFFYGFACSQLPGGYMSTKFGGARVLPLGMLLLSLATISIPFVGTDERSLFIARALVGLGEGVAPSAATDIIARSVSVSERSRAVGFVFSGFNIGSVLGLGVAPVLIENTSWRSVFWVFGSTGLLWSVWAMKMYGGGGMVEESYKDDRVTGLMGKRVFTADSKAQASGKKEDDPPVPWGEFISSTSVRALMYVHFCNNWGFYVLLAWLPSYFTDELGVTLTNASLLTLLPPLANVAMASVAGPTADRMIGSGMAVTRVRKTMQAVAFMGPALAMATAAYIEEPVATVGLLTLGLSLGAFSYAGLYSNHQDLSPKYASILLGMTNTCGALPGVIGVPLTGYLLKETENWELSMFFPAMFFYVTGTIVFAKYGSGDRQPFTGQPMPIEGEIVDRGGGGGH